MEIIYNGHSKESGIYKITNKVNNKIYIGSAKRFKERFSGHISSLKNNKHQNKHLQASWNKYGTDAFVFEIIEITNGTLKQRRKLEEKYIVNQMKLGNCFNQKTKTIKNESECWSSTPEETKQKLREARKNFWTEDRKKEYSEIHWSEDRRKEQSERSKDMWQDSKYQEHMKEVRTGQTRSEETKHKLSEQKLGELNPMFGRDFSPEHREKMGLSRRDKKLGPKSEEIIKKMSESRKGKGCIPCKEETKLKISLANKGKTRTEEQNKKMAEAKIKEYNVWLLNLNGEKVFLNKITNEFLEFYGLKRVGLNKLVNNKIKEHCGWKKAS